MKSELINELAGALAKAQGEMTNAKKEASNPLFKSKYADLSSVWEAARIPLSKNGLSISQVISQGSLITLLLHSSGQWIESIIILEPEYKTPQALGSAITYARRYGLAAIVGVASEDDDGNEASGLCKSKATNTKDEIDMSAPPKETLKGDARVAILNQIIGYKIDAEKISEVIKKNFNKDKYIDLTESEAKNLLTWAKAMSEIKGE